MRKALEAQLVSLAHRILQMKDKSEVAGLYREAQALYETLAALHLYQTQFEHVPVQPDAATWEAQVVQAHQAHMEALSAPKPSLASSADEKAEVPTDETPAATILFDLVLPTTAETETEVEVPAEKSIEVAATATPVATADHVTEETQEEIDLEEEIEAETEVDVTSDQAEVSAPWAPEPPAADPVKSLFEEALGGPFEEPVFVRPDSSTAEIPASAAPSDEMAWELNATAIENETEVASAPFDLPAVENEETPVEASVSEPTPMVPTSPVATLAGFNPFEAPIQPVKRSITIGLNDRIGFVKHLFADSNEDFNRVLSQLNSFNSWDEARDFIDNFVKPDYDQWKGLDDYETRFLEVIEKKFR